MPLQRRPRFFFVSIFKSLFMPLIRLARVSFWRNPAALVLLPATIAAAVQVNAAPPPIIVEADQFHVYLADEIAVWRGNVHATQGNYTFRTAQLTVRLDDVLSSGDAGTGDATGASGSKDEVELQAERVTYDIERDEIQGLGNSELRRGIEFIRADNIIYEVKRRIARAEPGSAGRVRVQLLSAPGNSLFPASNIAAGAGAGD